MAGWDDKKLVIIDDGDEIEIEAQRADGSFGKPVVVWAVRLGRHLYVRSARGPFGRWYQNALETGVVRVGARGVQEVVLAECVPPEAAEQSAIDREYHRKYDRFGSIVDSVVGPDAARVTLRLTPTD